MNMKTICFPYDIYKSTVKEKPGIALEYNKDITNSDNYVIESIVFEPPYTIVNWGDKTKTMAYCDECDNYDMVTGTTLCILKKVMGNTTVNKVLADIYKLQERMDKNPTKKKWTIDYRDKNKNKINHPKYRFDLYFRRDGNHRCWIAISTELNGCTGEGKTAKEAINKLRLNEIEWIKTAKKHGVSIPKSNSKK